MKSRNIEWEQNQLTTSLEVFLHSYNQNLPTGFPPASIKLLRKFQAAYPVLFKQSDEWSIDKHRKRVMDWLSSYRDSV